MTAPTPTPGASPAPGAETTPGAGGQPSVPASKDYEAQLRAGGEWTVEETKRQASRADKAEARLREIDGQLGGLRDVLKGGGMTGDQIANHLSTWQALRRDPMKAAAIDAAIRGAPAQKPPDDDFVDPEVKALREELDKIRGQVREQSTFAGQQALTRHFEIVAEKLGLEGDDLDGVRNKLIAAITAGGDEMARSVMSERGAKAVELMTFDALGFEGMQKLAEKRLLRTHQLRHEMETDGPSPALSSDTPPPPVYKTPMEAAIQSLRLARANPAVTRGTRA